MIIRGKRRVASLERKGDYLSGKKSEETCVTRGKEKRRTPGGSQDRERKRERKRGRERKVG